MPSGTLSKKGHSVESEEKPRDGKPVYGKLQNNSPALSRANQLREIRIWRRDKVEMFLRRAALFAGTGTGLR